MSWGPKEKNKKDVKILSVNQSCETDKIGIYRKKSSLKQGDYWSLLGKWWNINLNNAHKTTITKAIKPLRREGLRSHRSQRGTPHCWSTWIHQRICPLWSRGFVEQSVLWWIKIVMPISWDELSEKKQSPNNPNRYKNHRSCFIENWNSWHEVPLRGRDEENFVKIDERFITARYLEILRNNVNPQRLYTQYLTKHHNVPVHRAAIVSNWIEENWMMLCWSARSPDLSSIN
jgi:hypothetical protein